MLISEFPALNTGTQCIFQKQSYLSLLLLLPKLLSATFNLCLDSASPKA